MVGLQGAPNVPISGLPAGVPGGVVFPPPGSVGAGPQNIVVPPTVVPPPGGQFPQGFVPFGHGQEPERVRPPLFPQERTPSPVIPPPPPVGMYGPQPPVIPPGPYPGPVGPVPHFDQPGVYRVPHSESSEEFIPPPPSESSSRSGSPHSGSAPSQVMIIPPPAGYAPGMQPGMQPGMPQPVTIIPPPPGQQPATIINVPTSTRPSSHRSSSPEYEHRPTPSPAEAVAPDEGRVGSPRRSPRREHEEAHL